MNNSLFFDMNFGNDMYSYDIERIADLKSMAEYGKRTIKRLQDELKEVQQTIEKQMLIIDNINNLFATTKASTYCTNEQSIIYQTLSKESLQKKDSALPEILEPKGDLYNYPQTTEIISALKKANDFQDFFYDFPLAFVALFDQSPIQFNTDEIILEVETWPTERRIDFFTSFFEHLNSVAFFLSSLLSLVDCQSIPTMSEYLETGLSSILNCARVAFFMFDNEEDELIMEKHQLQMRMQLNNGIIFESLQKNKQSLVSRGFENISKDDLSLLKKNHVVLSVPVYCNSTPTALLLLYDKIGGFRQYDYIIGQTLSKFISQAIPIILMRQEQKKVSKMLHGSLDSFLQLVSAKDLKTFLKVVPSTFSQHFQCEDAKVYKISEDGQFFSEIVDEGISESFPINTGIIGESITQMEAINVTHPEFSVSFCAAVDRSNPTVITNSILSCPILDEEKKFPRFVIALFNKKDLDSFTDHDIEKVKMVCENLNNIITSLLTSSDLTMAVENSEHMVSLYNSLFDMFAALSMKDNLNDSFNELREAIKKSIIEKVSVDLFYVERPYKNISSADGDYNARLSSDDIQDPIVRITSSSETKELLGEPTPTILSGLKSAEDEPIGLFKIIFENDSKLNSKKLNNLSVFQSSTSFIIKNDENPLKSQSKFEKSPQFKDLNDKPLEEILSFWQKLIGPIIDLIVKKNNILKLIRICDNVIDKLPSDPFLAVSVFNDLQCVLNSNDQKGEKNDHFEMTVIDKNDDFYQRTRDLIVSFSLLLASSQKETESLENDDDDQYFSNLKKSFDFTPDSKYNSILNDSKFDVFSFQNDFLNELIISALSNFGVLNFLSIDSKLAYSLIDELRSMHTSNGFQTWDLAVDHFQFASFLLQNLGKKVLITIEQITAILFYLLSLYCVPYLNDPEMNLDKPQVNSVYTPSELITKFYIENGEGIMPLSSFIAAVSRMNDQSAIKKESIDAIAPLMKKLDCTQSFDFLNTGELYIFITCISQYSYLSRSPEISKKWIDKRLKEEFSEDELQNDSNDSYSYEILMSQIDFELKSILMPTFGEIVKKDIKIDHIRKLFTSTMSAITENTI